MLLRNTALEAMRAYGTDTTRRMYFIEYSISAPLEAAFCVAVPPGSEGEFVTLLPPTDALSIYHHGVYEDLPAVGRRLLEYAAEHQFSPRGTLRHIYLEGPPQHKDPSKFITLISTKWSGSCYDKIYILIIKRRQQLCSRNSLQ